MLVFDIEIKKAISPKNQEELIPGVEYCNGWGDHANMGIACLCWLDMDTGLTGVACDDNLNDFRTLCHRKINNGHLIGSFNGINFDNKVLAANGWLILEEHNFDLLRAIWKGAGLDPNKFSENHGGYGLDAMAVANGIPGKTGNGAIAPVLWQQGKTGEVISYCHHDVWITAELIKRAQQSGVLVCPKTGGSIPIDIPKL